MAFTVYDEWGTITHWDGYVMGERTLDTNKNYTGHAYDTVLEMYQAKYRMYGPENRRFTQIDPILDGDNYAYVGNNPIN